MVSIMLIGITVVVSLWAFSSRFRIERLGFNAYMVHKAGQFERFITHGFIHGDANHLMLNMLVLYFFAPDVETIFGYILGPGLGSIVFLLFFLSAIIVASVPDYFKQQHNQNYLSVGASGGVAAVVFSSIVISPLSAICLYGALCMPGIIWGVIYLGYSYYQGENDKGSRINHGAHLWGAVFGVVFTMILLLLTGNSPVF